MERTLLGEPLSHGVSLALYDLTSVCFEGGGRSGSAALATAGTIGRIGPKCSWRWPPIPKAFLCIWRCCATTTGPGTTAKSFGQGGGGVDAVGHGAAQEARRAEVGQSNRTDVTAAQSPQIFAYAADAQGQIQWSRRAEGVDQGARLDGLDVPGTNATAEQIPGAGVLGHYKNLLEVEHAFCHLPPARLGRDADRHFVNVQSGLSRVGHWRQSAWASARRAAGVRPAACSSRALCAGRASRVAISSVRKN